MIKKIKTVCNWLLSPVCLEIHRRGSDANWQRKVVQLNDELSMFRFQKKNKELWIKQLSLQTIIDVGANLGQFSLEMRRLLPEVNIYAFEPLPDCFARLEAAFSGDRHFQAFNMGLGDASGAMGFDRNQFSASSSFLEKTDAHIEAFPFTANTSKEMVKIERLDNVMKGIDIISPFMLKIDVQGFEEQVLRGGEATARNANIILLETSFVELYRQQPLFNDIYALLIDWGFDYQGSFEQLRDPGTGITVQEDSVFVRHK